jgi:IclR family pca regulon transcriptional regulator
MQLPELAQPYLDRLRDRANGSAHVGILDGAEVVYVARSASRSIWGTSITVGSRLPAHATSIGKTLLAAKDAASLKEWLRGRELARYTKNTLAEQRAFVAELAQIRSHGYAISNQEFELGLRSVAAPIRNEGGDTIAALNVTAPAATFNDEVLGTVVIPAVVETAGELSAAYGWRGNRSRQEVGA